MKELSAWLSVNTPLEPEPGEYVERFARERMRLIGCDTPIQYVDRLSRDPDEAQILFQHMAPPETWLFRYVAAFEALRAGLTQCDRSRVIHVASLGCATGSEPHSIAATALSCGLTGQQIRILALDNDASHIEAARTGRASAFAQRTPIPSWACQWFHPSTHGQLQLDARGLEMIDFERADLSNWKPMHQFDFVFCRNVAIYLSRDAKRRLGMLLGQMTSPKGVLFLGHADSAVLEGSDFKRLDIDQAFAFSRSQPPGEKAAPRPAPLSTGETSRRREKVEIQVHPPAIRAEPAVQAHDLLAQARIAADAGDLPAAEMALIPFLSRNPGEPEAHLLHGCILMAQKKYDDAQRSFTKAVYLDPANALGLLSLAAIAEMRGDEIAAERYRGRAARTEVEPRRE